MLDFRLYKMFLGCLVLFILNGCTDSKNEIKEEVEQQNIFEPISFYITDTTDKSKPYVRLKTIDENGTYLIDWGINDKKWHGNLVEMTKNQGYRMPPTVLWSDERFICVMTNHSSSYSQHLFLPLKNELKTQFFKEDIEYIDSINHFVIYLEDDYDNQNVNWTIQSLVDNTKEVFEIPIFENSSGYPWYRNIERKGNFIYIEPQGNTSEIIKKNIKKYCYKE